MSMLQSECFDGILFNNLLTIWKFGRGLTDRTDTCMLDFFVSFGHLFSLVDYVGNAFVTFSLVDNTYFVSVISL